jgi:DNA-directed RNA polymerase specialized sigma24 family protein
MCTVQPTVRAARDELRSLLGALDPGDRAVVHQLHVLRSSPFEAATVLGLPVTEVHLRATRAVRQLSRGARQLGAA